MKSTPCTGSSSTRKSGLRSSARAISARCCSPPDSAVTGVAARWVMPVSSSTRAISASPALRVSVSSRRTVSGIVSGTAKRCGT
jgi:hypothetical protein